MRTLIFLLSLCLAQIDPNAWRKDPEFTIEKSVKSAELIDGANWASDWHWRVYNMTQLGLSLHLDY
jgi:hypothetical protein